MNNTYTQETMVRAAISGIIAIVIGLIMTVLAAQIWETTDLQWSLIAVGVASFFSAFAGYMARVSQENNVT